MLYCYLATKGPVFVVILLCHVFCLDCTVFILDDITREGDEEFTVTIVTKDPTVRISTSKATVTLSDPEDGEFLCIAT